MALQSADFHTVIVTLDPDSDDEPMRVVPPDQFIESANIWLGGYEGPGGRPRVAHFNLMNYEDAFGTIKVIDAYTRETVWQREGTSDGCVCLRLPSV
jgi:hypothetical protein